MPYKICLKNPTENTNLYGYLFSIWQISLTSHSIFCRIWVLCLYYLNNHSSISAWLQLHKVWKNIHLTTHTWFSLSEYLQLVYRTSNTRSNDTWIDQTWVPVGLFPGLLFAWKYTQEPSGMYGELCWNANWTHFVGTCRGFSLLHNFSKVCYTADSYCLFFKSVNPPLFPVLKVRFFLTTVCRNKIC